MYIFFGSYAKVSLLIVKVNAPWRNVVNNSTFCIQKYEQVKQTAGPEAGMWAIQF